MSRAASDRVNHATTSSKSIHPMYKPPPPLSSMDAPAPLPPYTEPHFDEQDLPRLVVRNESAPANVYVESSASPYQASPHGVVEVPRRSPTSESLPLLPPMPEGLLHSEGNLPSQSGEVSPFADPISELRPGRSQENNSSGARNIESQVSMVPVERKSIAAYSMNGNNEDAYDGII
jgi:hypothetical protein